MRTLPATAKDINLSARNAISQAARAHMMFAGCQHQPGLTIVAAQRRFLLWFRERHRNRRLSGLRGTDVVEFITDQVDAYANDRWRNRLTSQTKIFLWYLLWTGLLATDLARVVPKLRRWRLASPPPPDLLQPLRARAARSGAVTHLSARSLHSKFTRKR